MSNEEEIKQTKDEIRLLGESIEEVEQTLKELQEENRKLKVYLKGLYEHNLELFKYAKQYEHTRNKGRTCTGSVKKGEGRPKNNRKQDGC